MFNAGISGDNVFSRYGPMIRATGSPTSASFYCLSIGDVRSSDYPDKEIASRSARLFKVSDVNLSQDGPNEYNTAWSTGASVTELASAVTLPKTNVKFRLQAEGTLISVQSSPSPYSVWTIIASAVDSSIASGDIGFFSKALNQTDFRSITLEGPIVVSDLTERAVNVEAQLLYLSIGPEANITTESG